MNKALFTYGFLFILISALATLAVFQYKWIGSVSEAEKIRLENSIDASTENFLADFSSIFSGLRSRFSLSLAQNEDLSAEEVGQLYTEWKQENDYPDLIDGVYLVSNINEDRQDIQYYDPGQKIFIAITENSPVQTRINYLYPALIDTNLKISVRDLVQSYPNFGFPTIVMVPVQKVSLITLNRDGNVSGMDVRLSMNISSDILMLKLNDSILKNKVIPTLAERYFSQDYREIYNLGIYRMNDDSVSWYYREDLMEIPDNPLVDKAITFNKRAELVMVGRSSFKLSDIPLNPQKLDLSIGAPGSLQVSEVMTNSDTDTAGGNLVRFNFRDPLLKNDGSNSSSFSTIQSVIRDNSWKFVLSFRAGTLDAYINEARFRNLLISFGILLVLGITGVLIIINNLRSRKLAEQQMAFVSGVSHELKTPVTVIRSAAENLLEGVVKDEKRQKKYAEIMLKEGKRLSTMVDQLLSFAGIQSGKQSLVFTEMNTMSLIQELNEELQNILTKSGTAIQYFKPKNPITFEADPEALKTALINLLLNAIKFSEKDPDIRFRIELKRDSGRENILFKVEDEGMGIPEEEQREIFKPFYRGEKAAAMQIKGNGIGLSLVRKIAEEHGGDVQVKSESGEGSVFTLTIPLKQKNR